MAILRKKEELDGYQIDDQVIEYIAQNVKSNIRELEGSLNKIMAYANLENRVDQSGSGRKCIERYHIPKPEENYNTGTHY